MDLKQTVSAMLMLVLASINVVVAETVVEQQQRIIQEQQQRQQELRDQIDQQQNQRESITVLPQPDLDKKLGGPCFDISSIELDGSEHLPVISELELVEPYLNQCIDLDKINQLLKAISNWYFERGYITSRAYVAAQDLSAGHLVITVIEGTVESIELTDPDSRINTSTAFPFAENQLLNLREIEQGLEQINRLQSNQATMDLVPGEAPGSSIIQLKSTATKPWVASLSRDNSGQESTGELMNGLFLGLDNPLGLNDYTYLNVQKDNTSANDKASKSIAWHWDMPLGYWNMGVDISYFEYLSTVDNITSTFETSGTNLSQQLFLSRVMYRDQTSKLKLRTSLERKKTQNFIEDVLLDSSRVLGIANIGIEYDKYLPNQNQWQLALNYYRGLSLFDAPKDEDRATGAPKAQFDKFSASINYQQHNTFKLSEKTTIPLFFQSKLHLQHSSDRLFGSEQISIGSLYTIRGYKGSSIAASSGGYWRNSLTLPFRVQSGGNFLQGISPFIAFDIGTLRDRDHRYGRNTYADLKGWAMGTRLSGKHYSINLVYAKPIDNPRWLSASKEQWYFNLSVNL